MHPEDLQPVPRETCKQLCGKAAAEERAVRIDAMHEGGRGIFSEEADRVMGDIAHDDPVALCGYGDHLSDRIEMKGGNVESRIEAEMRSLRERI